MHRLFSSIVALVLLAGCSLVPAYETPNVELPAGWEGAGAPTQPVAATQLAPVSAQWWSHLGNDELDRLMAEALAANPELDAALQRIRQARASLRSTGAALSPTIDALGSVSEEVSRQNGRSDDRNAYAGQLEVSYELDLWGRNRAAVQSATEALAASQYDHDALALVVQAEVASAYVGALAAKDRLAIARSNLELARALLDLIEVRYAEGRSSSLEVAQQRLEVASQEAAIPELERQLRANETALAILLGRIPQGFHVSAPSLATLTLPQIDAGQPADVLTRRPDIARAEAELRAANADIGIARAAFFPTVDLSLSAAVSGMLTAGNPTTAASLASGLVAPIFSGGRLEGDLERTEARFAELAANYRQSVLLALQEAENALVAVDSAARRADRLDEAVLQARDAFGLAQLRYDAGAVDFISVIDAQRSQLSAEDSLIQAQLDRYAAAIDLFRALGGGWTRG